jgi:cyanophycinase
MKYQHVLPLLLATMVISNDEAENASSGLRGSALRDSAPLLDMQKGEGGDADFGSSFVDDAQRNRKAQLVAEMTAPAESTIPFIIPHPRAPRPTISDPAPVIVPLRPTLGGILPPSPTPAPITPTPPIREETFDVNGNMCGMSTSGTVILHGGAFNYEDPLSDSLGQAIVREMRTNSNNRLMDPLVFIPGARRDVSDEDETTFENEWRDIMTPGVAFSVLHADDQEPEFTNVADAAQADTDGFVRPLRDAMGVFLPGGRQWRFIDAYNYTQTEDEMWNVLKRGGVVAGTSAGAAVMESLMPRGDPAGSAAILADREWYQHGFGFVSNIAVDNHFSARGRELTMYDVFNAKLANRKLLGIGLNENTMAVVKDRYFQVRGDRGSDSVVRVYDCSGINEFETCSFDNAPYTELTPGNWYDLCGRRQMSAPPPFNDLDKDLDRRLVLGAYGLPWDFRKDFKNGNPDKFLCSGRRCTFTSNPIVVDNKFGNFVRITGKVFSGGSEFSDSDRLVVQYRVGNDEVWREVWNSAWYPGRTGNSPFGQYIFSGLVVPTGKSTVFVQIEAETGVEGDAEFQVRDLKIQ